MIKLFVIFCIICSMFFTVGSPIRQTQELFFQVGGTITFLLALFFFLRKEKLTKLVGIFGVYACLLFLLGDGKTGGGTMLNIVIGCMLYYATLHLKKEQTKSILKCIIAIALINLAYAILQMWGLDFIYGVRGAGGTIRTDIHDFVGLLGLKACMGMWVQMALIATLSLSSWAWILFLIPLYMCQASSVIVASVGGILFYFWWSKRKVFYVLLPALLIAGGLYIGLVDTPMGMMPTRLNLWKVLAKDTVYCNGAGSRFLRNPITGFGLDAFRMGRIKYFIKPQTQEIVRGVVQPNNVLTDVNKKPFKQLNGQIHYPDGTRLDLFDNCHSMYFQLFYEMGLCGIIIMCCIIYELYRRFKNSIKTKELVTVTGLIISLFLVSVGQFPLWLGRLGFIFPILGGLFMINSQGHSDHSSEDKLSYERTGL